MSEQKTLGPGSPVMHHRFGRGVVRAVRQDGACQVEFVALPGTKWIRPEFLADPQAHAAALAAEAGWPAGTFVQEAPDTPHYMGAHWEPFGIDVRDLLTHLPDMLNAVQVQSGWATHHAAGHEVPAKWLRGAQLAWPDLDHGVALVLRLDEQENRLVSFFPFHQQGTQTTLKLRQVSVWDSGVEAQITAAWGEAEVTFFDTRHVIDRAWYVAGRQYDFILCGLAYDAAPAQVQSVPFEFTPDVVARLHALLPADDVPVAGPTTLSFEGAAWLLPVPGWDADEHRFRGPILDVNPFHDWLGQDGWTARVTVMRSGPKGGDQNLDIHMTRRAWKGSEAPRIGQDIEGQLWLQGYLWVPHRTERQQ